MEAAPHLTSFPLAAPSGCGRTLPMACFRGFRGVADGDSDLRHVIVKFSEPVDNHPAARRWADLLICEHLASEVLADEINASARSELVWSQGRLCLEVTRFDRSGAHGRRGCVTLAAWSDAHDGERDDWASATRRMQQGGWLSEDAQRQIRLRWWFGRMVAKPRCRSFKRRRGLLKNPHRLRVLFVPLLGFFLAEFRKSRLSG